MARPDPAGDWAPPELELHNRQTHPVPPAAAPAGARWALRLVGGRLDRLSLVLVDSERITRLNVQFLGHEGPTDVLAFAAEATEEGLSAEVIICVPVAAEQAAEHGHSLARELALLAAHGALHTLGYRDDTPAGRQAMGALQERAADLAVAELESSAP